MCPRVGPLRMTRFFALCICLVNHKSLIMAQTTLTTSMAQASMMANASMMPQSSMMAQSSMAQMASTANMMPAQTTVSIVPSSAVPQNPASSSIGNATAGNRDSSSEKLVPAFTQLFLLTVPSVLYILH